MSAATLFIDCLLSKDGQSAFSRALGRPTRRVNVDTQWTKEFGHVSTKEALTAEKYDEMENGSEEMLLKVRKPAIS
jgi:ABC-type Fe3+ transport system substrate-binding protein